jgi:hypothetical protein
MLFDLPCPCKEMHQFGGVDNAPPFDTDGQCGRALPNGQFTTSSLPRSSCFLSALPMYSPHKVFANPLKSASACPAPLPGGVAGGTSGGVGSIASAGRAVPSEATHDNSMMVRSVDLRLLECHIPYELRIYIPSHAVIYLGLMPLPPLHCRQVHRAPLPCR